MPRVFEQGNNVTPIGSYRVASGKAGFETINHSWNTIKEWLEDVLSFMKGDNNLNEITNSNDARNNLEIYSTAQTQQIINDAISELNSSLINNSMLELIFSANIFGRGTVVDVEDTAVFDPIYINPKYSGTTFTIQKMGVGKYTITHNLNLLIHKQCVNCHGSMGESTVGCESIYIKPNYMKLTFSDDASANNSDSFIQLFKII